MKIKAWILYFSILFSVPLPGQEVVTALRHPTAATPTFTHVQSMTTCSNPGAATSISCSFPSNPATNDVVCIALGAGFTTGVMGTLTVEDGAGTPNTYTNSPSSPYLGLGGFFEPLYAAISCLYVAPSSANKTITASWTGLNSNFSSIWGDEWSVSSGTASADTDNAASGTASGTSINTTPTLTPAVSGELLYAIVIPGDSECGSDSRGNFRRVDWKSIRI